MRDRDPEARARRSLAQKQRREDLGDTVVWTQERVETLRRLHASGGRDECYRGLPEMRPGQINAAIRRYCTAPGEPTGSRAEAIAYRRGTRSPWSDPTFHARFLEALTDRTQFH